MIAKVALFSRGNRGYALAVEQIDQIVTAPRVFELPLIPASFQGVFLYRGEAVPLLDLKNDPALREPDCPVLSAFTVVLHSEVGRVGLSVDEVLHIVGRGQGTIETRGETEGCGHRVFLYAGQQYFFLDVESFLTTLLDTPDPDVQADGTEED